MIQELISIWPYPLRAVRPRFTPQSTYEIPEAPFDGFQRLKVTDQQEFDYLGAGQRIFQVVQAADLANDLVQDFRRYACGGSGRVGVFIAPRVGMTDEEIVASDEYRKAREEQDIIMGNIVSEARELFSNNKPRSISKLHHVAAAYLNIEGEDWQNRNASRSATKECPFCNTFVPSKAVVCQKCMNVIDPEGHAKLEAEIKNRIEAIKQQQTLVPDNGGSALRPALKKPAMAGV